MNFRIIYVLSIGGTGNVDRRRSEVTASSRFARRVILHDNLYFSLLARYHFLSSTGKVRPSPLRLFKLNTSLSCSGNTVQKF
jgi:hypothetical protein